MVEAAAARFGAGFRAARVARRARAQPRGPGPGRPLRGAARGRRSPATPPTTRPRPCCSTCCGARGSTGWPACRPAATRSSACAGPRPGRLCQALGLDVGRRPDQRRPCLPPQPGAPRAAAAARRHRRPRRGAACWPGQAALLRDEADLLDELAAGHRPHRRRGPGRRARSPWPAGPCAGGCRRREPPARRGHRRAGAGRGAGRGPAPPRWPAGSVVAQVGRSASSVTPTVASRPCLATRIPNLGPVVVAEDELQDRIAELGKEITADYEGGAAAGRRAQGRVRVHEPTSPGPSTCRSSSTSWRCRPTAAPPRRAASSAS